MTHLFGERPKRQPDVFGSPNDPSHEYVVQGPDTDESLVDLDGVTRVTVLTPEGATSYSRDAVLVDRLKLRPRLGKTVHEIVAAANYAWPLADNEQGDDING